jgi:hypothetical protein
MTTPSTSEPGGTGAPRPLDNGLAAMRYVPLTDIEPDIGRHLLTALGRARIAAYLDESPGREDTRRLFVAAEERSDARTIVAAVVRAAGGTPPVTADEPAPRPDPLAGVDLDAAFADLISDWHVDTVTAIRNAEKALSRDDADWKAALEHSADPVWLDDQHYVPPPPPPLPRLAAPTITAMAVIAISILLLGLAGQFGIANRLTLLLGVLGVLLGAGILVMRLRERHDDDDDGAVL